MTERCSGTMEPNSRRERTVLGWALGLLYGTATSGGQALYEIGRAHV